jgi:2-keto-4-pentenoate hydratase/2-oxohepta-3-ene-1,7-dioic acid hydratase in catechol pathway
VGGDRLPFPRPSKIICVGRNYLAHARELGNEVPSEPLIFFKPPSALIPSGDPIVLPTGVGRVDFEGEIGLLLARGGRSISREEAAGCVHALVPLNDVTARELQRSDSQWTRAKGFDTFCPVGTPIPVSPGVLEAVGVRTLVNGEARQEARARDMAFDIPFLISWISGIMTLEPGDLIATGTPEGVAPLSAGDSVTIEILGAGSEVLGSVQNPVRAA